MPKKPKQSPMPKPCGPFIRPWLPNPIGDPNFNQAWLAHARLSQALFALGSGAGSIRITAAGAAEFYKRLWHGFYTQAAEGTHKAWLPPGDGGTDGNAEGTVTEYLNHGPQILDMSRAVGRLAAQYATCEGRFAIDVDDVDKALDKVKGQYSDNLQTAMEPFGIYCIPDPNDGP